MYQYKGYTIQNGRFGYAVWSPNGTMYGPFATDKDAEAFIDSKVA